MYSQVSICAMSEVKAISHGVFVFLLDIDGCFLLSPEESQWNKLQTILLQAASILWVTRGGAVESTAPERSLITGFARSLRSENHGTAFVTLDLDPEEVNEEQQASHAIWRVLNGGLSATGKQNSETPDFEYAMRRKSILIPRLPPDLKIQSHVQDSVSRYHPSLVAQIDSHQSIQPRINNPGLLDSLYWTDADTQGQPMQLQENQVRIKMDYASLNFKDLMAAMGQLKKKNLHDPL